MSDTYELTAQLRERVGKGAARELRRNKLVPAVIYGDNKDPLPIALSDYDLKMTMAKGGFFTTVGNIDVGGEKHKILAKDFQTDPVRDFIIHVDFLRVTARSRVVVEVPVHFINEEECPGIKVGGVLNVSRHVIEISCRADSIPESFEVDLTGKELEEVIHVSTIALPDGVELTETDRDYTICSIMPPTVYSEPEPGEDGAAEGEDAPAEAKEDGGDEKAEEGGEES